MYGKYASKACGVYYRYCGRELAETKNDADISFNLSMQSCKLNKECLSLLAKNSVEGLPAHQRIRYARLTAGLSAVQLCEKLNITKSMMVRYENGLITMQGMDVELLKNIGLVCGRDKHFCMDSYHIFKDNSDVYLRKYMQDYNLTDLALVEKLGVTEKTVKNWKKSCPSYELWRTELEEFIAVLLSEFKYK